MSSVMFSQCGQWLSSDKANHYGRWNWRPKNTFFLYKNIHFGKVPQKGHQRGVEVRNGPESFRIETQSGNHLLSFISFRKTSKRDLSIAYPFYCISNVFITVVRFFLTKWNRFLNIIISSKKGMVRNTSPNHFVFCFTKH